MNALNTLTKPLAYPLARLKAMLAAVLALCLSASAQVSTAVDNIIPPSPEAAALGKYVEIPVGLYTGTPQINIPLWELREGDITLPISLSYHASGIRADEIAGRTGMGWVLNAGGVITRTIVGEADEYGPGGFLRFSLGNTPTSVFSGTESEKFNRWNQLVECGDAEPDHFTFNFGGYSGKFVFDWNRKVAVSSERSVAIEPVNMNPGTGSFISAWKVTGDDGTVYLFEAKETSYVTKSGINPCLYTTPPVTSWYLTRITAPSGDFVAFSYQPYTEEYRIRLSETTNHRYGTAQAITQERMESMKIGGQYLSGITTSSGNTTIRFINAATARTDLPQTVAGNTNVLFALGEIVVLNRDNVELKHFVQEYDYSAGRLTLKSLREAASKPPYRFAYNGAMPAFGSQPVGFYTQDHWGYLNNNTKNMLTPPYQISTPGSIYTFDGANREASEGGSKAGMLTQIKYPAGGTTTFDYELHTYSTIGNKPITENQSVVRSASVRHSGDLSGSTYDSKRRRVPFTIVGNPTDTVHLRFQVNLAYCSTTGLGGGILGPSARILNTSGNPVYTWLIGAGSSFYRSDSVKMAPGSYVLEVFADNRPCYYEGVPTPGWDNAYIGVDWNEGTGVVLRKNKPAGGVRIKRITDYDGINPSGNIVRRFDYGMNEGDTVVSSGVVTEEPQYEFDTYIMEQVGSVPSGVPYKSRISNSIIALGDTRGSHIGYRQVTVFYGENGEDGKSESSFTSFNDINDRISYKLPFQPVISYDYCRGLLKKQVDYKYENGTFTPVKQTVNDYTFNDGNLDISSVFALKVGERVVGARLNGVYTQAEDVFALGGYAINLGIARLKTSEETVFDGGRGFTKQQSYTYDARLQFLQRQSLKTSDGKEQVTEYTYPADYAAPNAAISALQARHILNPVVEKIIKERSADGTERVTGAAFTEFGLFNGLVLPARQLQLAATTPVTDFRLSKNYSGSFDARYYREASSFNRYNTGGKPEQVTAPGDIVTSYIWGYGGSLPVAQVINSVFIRCAYTGFESADRGNWNYSDVAASYSTDAKTGRRCFTGSVSSNALPGGQYVVSVWARGAAGGTIAVNGQTKTIDAAWKLYEWIVADPGTVTLNTNGNWVDDLRLHPRDAQMKTFTYQPQLGISSATDARNLVSYYNYDALGRLKNIKDTDGNILKNYRYQYAGN